MRLPLRPLVLAAALVLSVAAPAAAAPTWLPSFDLSAPSGSPSGSVVASDALGETFAAWLRNDGANTRVEIAGHVPGAAFTAPLVLSDAGQSATAPSLSVALNGVTAVAWSRSDGSKLRVQVTRRLPGGTFTPATTVSAVGVDSINPVVATDRLGDVVVLWEDSSLLALHARRFSAATQSWGAIEDLAAAGLGQGIGSLALVITDNGVATAAWSFDPDASNATQWQVQTRSEAATGAWTPVVQPSNTVGPDQSAGAQLALDDAGNVTLVWADYRTASCGGFCIQYVASVVRTATRGGTSGAWSATSTLSDPNLVSDAPRVAVTPAGDVTVAWTEQLAQTIKVVTKPVAGAFPPAANATQITPNDKQISSSGAHGFPQTSLHIAANASGTIVTFARLEDGTNALAEAVYRPAGGAWPTGPPTVLSPPGIDIGSADGPSVAIDPVGNGFVSWTSNSSIKGAALDVSAPVFTSLDVAGSLTAGQPVTLSASALDVWSALGAGQPTWAFGDGTTGAGATVSHVYAKAGTYIVSATFSDAVGNTSAPQSRPIVIAATGGTPGVPAITIAKPKLSHASYTASRLVGSIQLQGTSPLATTLTLTLRKRGTKQGTRLASLTVKSGSWSVKKTLPRTLLPGTYDVIAAGKGIAGATVSFSIAAPKEGVVKKAFATGPRRGPAATSLSKTSELWAHFSFGSLPKKGQTITTQWTLPGGKKLAANTRPRSALVEAQVKDLSGKNLPSGRWSCVIRAGGTVVATLHVRLK